MSFGQPQDRMAITSHKLLKPGLVIEHHFNLDRDYLDVIVRDEDGRFVATFGMPLSGWMKEEA